MEQTLEVEEHERDPVLQGGDAGDQLGRFHGEGHGRRLESLAIRPLTDRLTQSMSLE